MPASKRTTVKTVKQPQPATFFAPKEWKAWHGIAFALLVTLTTATVLIASAQISACYQKVTQLGMHQQALELEISNLRRERGAQNRKGNDVLADTVKTEATSTSTANATSTMP